MGNDGNNNNPEFQIAEFERKSDRIYIPKHLGELVGLDGLKQVDCWLLVVSPGHYRCAFQPQGEKPKGDLADILEALRVAKISGDLLKGTDSDPEAAIVARLIVVSVSPKKGAWRLTIPKVTRRIAPLGDAAKFVFLTVLGGHIEIWFPETLKQAMSVPISEVLP
jgi:hypothetical protein